jgi:glycosyltransferase involved in cell wall biosynthesis
MLAALIMLKNEEESIKITLDSIKNHIKHVIVYDTGSTDSTIEVCRELCKRNGQVFHLKEGTFKNFPESRNESIEFAESIAKKNSIEFFLLLDAADEFKTDATQEKILQSLDRIPSRCSYGIVKKHWLEQTGTIEHYDIRFIRSGRKCRYDLKYPVHETFSNKSMDNMIFLENLFTLYQNRFVNSESSVARFRRDIEMLSAAPVNKRNYYYLSQTYMNCKEYENAYNHYILALQLEKDTEYNVLDDMGDILILVRILNCAIFLKKDFDCIFEYFNRIINMDPTNIDAYVFFFKYCLDNKFHDAAEPYIGTLATLTKPTQGGRTLINHNYYDYLRWYLISNICMKLTTHDEIGLVASQRALEKNNTQIENIYLQIFKNRIEIAKKKKQEARDSI